MCATAGRGLLGPTVQYELCAGRLLLHARAEDVVRRRRYLKVVVPHMGAGREQSFPLLLSTNRVLWPYFRFNAPNLPSFHHFPPSSRIPESPRVTFYASIDTTRLTV